MNGTYRDKDGWIRREGVKVSDAPVVSEPLPAERRAAVEEGVRKDLLKKYPQETVQRIMAARERNRAEREGS